MWTVADIGTEIVDAANLMHHKRKAGKTTDQLATSILAAVEAKITAVGMNCKIALQLIKTIEDSNFDESMINKLKDKIDQLLEGTQQTSTITGSMVIAKPQTISLPAYMTQQEWTFLADPNKGYMAKVTCLTKKVKHLGIKSMSEKTTKSLVATLLTMYDSLPDAATRHQMVRDFKLSFANQEFQHELPFLLQYPRDPFQLPQEIMLIAYQGTQPQKCVPDTYAHILTHPIESYKQDAATSWKRQQWKHWKHQKAISRCRQRQPRPWIHAHAIFPTTDGDVQGVHAHVPEEQLSRCQEAKQASCARSRAIENPCEPGRLETTSALEDKKPEAEPPLSNDAAPQPGGSEAIEAEAFNILRNRAACKAKAKAGPNAKPSMSPAGATKATKGMKRPAAKTTVENMIEYHVPMPDAKWEGRTKESWTSGHYQKCRKHAIAQGMTDDDAKANARIACAKALQKWNQRAIGSQDCAPKVEPIHGAIGVHDTCKQWWPCAVGKTSCCSRGLACGWKPVYIQPGAMPSRRATPSTMHA